jgi:hypothetical protein
MDLTRSEQMAKLDGLPREHAERRQSVRVRSLRTQQRAYKQSMPIYPRLWGGVFLAVAGFSGRGWGAASDGIPLVVFGCLLSPEGMPVVRPGFWVRPGMLCFWLFLLFGLVFNGPFAPPCVVCRGCWPDIDGEFDPGSGRTLAACLTHASRTVKPFGVDQWRTGE